MIDLLKSETKMGDNKKTRRKFLKLLGMSTFSMYFGCHGAKYLRLNQKCEEKNDFQEKIRIMSFNIANARGNNDDFFNVQPGKKIKYNLDWISALITNLNIDVACFNEMDFNSVRTGNIDMARYIADRVCYKHIISEQIFSAPPLLDLGNVVVSRYPLKLNTYHQYGHNFSSRVWHEFKSFLDFDVLLKNKTNLNMVLTHLNSQNQEARCEQTKILRTHIETKTKPFVLLGDFNSTPDSVCFKNITEKNLVRNPYLGNATYPSEKPDVQIDYILISQGLHIANYNTIYTKVSDHLPVIGDIIID